MRNFFVAAFLILFLLVVTSATPKQKETEIKSNMCHKLSKSCSSRRKCCKGLECAPKGYKTGKRCIEKQSRPTSNEDNAELIARINFQLTFTGLFDAIRNKTKIIMTSLLDHPYIDALIDLETAGDNLYDKAKSCEFVFNGNMNVMKAMENATGATSEAAEIAQNNIGPTGLGTGPVSSVLNGIKAETIWLRDALKDVSSFMGCDAQAIAESKFKFDESVGEAINSLMAPHQK